MAGSSGSGSSAATNINSSNSNTNNVKNQANESDGKYAAKRKDGTKSPKKEKNGNKLNNKDNKKNGNDKQNPKQRAKEQAATTAMSALGVPAPLAKALSKPVVNNLDKKKNNQGNDLLSEQQKINQGQERLNNIRNIAGALNESKKQKEAEENGEEEQSPSLMDQAEDIEAKAENISGIIKFIKMIPAPVWGGIIVTILIFFIGLVLFVSIQGTTGWTFVMQELSVGISGNSGGNNNTNINTGTNTNNGKLQYPTASRKISAGFPNYSSGKYHGGIDFPVPTGTDVYAAGDGTVITSKALRKSDRSYTSYGEYIEIDHGNGLTTLYAHNSQRLVQEGEKVTKGQVIAKSGSTGNSSGPHCHFEVKLDGKRVDPMQYLSDE